ncbi:hypothetical protein [Sphingomonas phyllosphaerae]|uniref:hypothetical protein n=1 Tax=Sphingomonas phyllosphaerae TaxID=257003 RepID=UPI002413A3FA|nr:hypothetical protein [Sphingomonas phyllosphaerae]
MNTWSRRNVTVSVLAAMAVGAGSPLLALNAPAPALPDDLFADLLREGDWTTSADDDAPGEAIPQALLRRMSSGQTLDTAYGSGAIGLLALTMGIAQWGISDPAGLPSDPAGKGWRTLSAGNRGKHFMSYATGGVGLFHADLTELQDFIDRVIGRGLVPLRFQGALRRTLDPARYLRHYVRYDELRAAGQCSSQQFTADLLGEPFHHRDEKTSCAQYANPKLAARDWLVFRTFSRIGLRDADIQRQLASRWLQRYWAKTIAKVPPGDGTVEEALVNVRIRNSESRAANEAFETRVSSVSARLGRQMAAYRKYKPSAYQRRCHLMLRPVVLWRHFQGLAPLKLEGLCP